MRQDKAERIQGFGLYNIRDFVIRNNYMAPFCVGSTIKDFKKFVRLRVEIHKNSYELLTNISFVRGALFYGRSYHNKFAINS